MQKYQSIISGTNGSVIRNVPVTVLKEDGSLAEIFMDREGQVQAPNPLVTDSRGVFYFYAKNGRYSLRTAADGVQITDADTVLLFDPDETVADGPIADAVRRAEDAAERAEIALSDSGLQNLVQDAQDAAANAAQAVIDANQAVASIDGALIEAGEAKDAAQAAAQTASNAASGAQAVKDSLLTYSGTLSATPEWSAVPAHEDLGLDAQTQAALNRVEKLKDDQQLLKQRADKAVLSYPDYAAASAAAATLPDGQVVEAPNADGVVSTYTVQAGVLANGTTTLAEAVNIGFDDKVAPAYLKTLSDIINGGEVSLLRFINPSAHSAIRNFTSTYDAAADIQDAFDSGARLLAPHGRYSHASSLLVRDGQYLRGQGWSVNYSGGALGVPVGTVFRLLPGADCDSFRQADESNRNSITLADFCVDGDGANQSSLGVTTDPTTGLYQFNRNGFYFTSLYNAIFRNVRAQNTRGSGFEFYGTASGSGMTNVFLEKCSAYNNRVFNAHVGGNATDVRVIGGDYGFGRCASLRVDTASNTVWNATFWTSQCQDITDPNTHASGTGAVSNTTAGVVLNGVNNKAQGCRSEGHNAHGFHMTANADWCELRGNTVYAVGGAATNTYDGINVGAAGDFKIIGNTVKSSLSTTNVRSLRRALGMDPAHLRATVLGNDFRNIGDSGVVPASGSFVDPVLASDITDLSWVGTDVLSRLSGNQTIGGAAWTVLALASEARDRDGEWDASAYTFTPRNDGRYNIRAQAAFTSAADGQQLGVSIYVNGVETARLAQVTAGAAGQTHVVGGQVDLLLNDGQTVDVRAYMSGSGGTCLSGNGLTFVTIVPSRR